MFYLAFYLAYLLAFSPAVEVRQGTLGVDSRSWGPAGNTGRGWSRLRSGREHWAWMVAVEVRQGTLGVDSRGWGPAGNAWRGFSRLRSGREHLAWMVVVEVRRRRKAAEGGRRRRKSTDIKSNNPHLAGGEKHFLTQTSHLSKPKFGFPYILFAKAYVFNQVLHSSIYVEVHHLVFIFK